MGIHCEITSIVSNKTISAQPNDFPIRRQLLHSSPYGCDSTSYELPISNNYSDNLAKFFKFRELLTTYYLTKSSFNQHAQCKGLIYNSFKDKLSFTHVNTNFSGLTHGKYSNNYRQKLECQVIYT